MYLFTAQSVSGCVWVCRWPRFLWGLSGRLLFRRLYCCKLTSALCGEDPPTGASAKLVNCSWNLPFVWCLIPALRGESFVHLGGNPTSLAWRRPSRCAEKKVDKRDCIFFRFRVIWDGQDLNRRTTWIEFISDWLCDDPLSSSCNLELVQRIADCAPFYLYRLATYITTPNAIVHSRSQVFSERLSVALCGFHWPWESSL